jgi:valyl-tRNA synthetase
MRSWLGDDPPGDEVLDVAAEVLAAVRTAKSAARRPTRAPIRATLRDRADRLHALGVVVDDVGGAGRIESLELHEADELAVDVEFLPDHA